MSAAEKQEPEVFAPAEIDPDLKHNVLHKIDMSFESMSGGKQGRPNFSDNSNYKSLSWWPSGGPEITHAEACKVYLEALQREKTARTVREYYGTVLNNWGELTEPVEDK